MHLTFVLLYFRGLVVQVDELVLDEGLKGSRILPVNGLVFDLCPALQESPATFSFLGFYMIVKI